MGIVWGVMAKYRGLRGVCLLGCLVVELVGFWAYFGLCDFVAWGYGVFFRAWFYVLEWVGLVGFGWWDVAFIMMRFEFKRVYFTPYPFYG